ncbi:hypothetical protein L2E82_49251 [Cichorium intybus]|uniref:Uncharacterized protein n=1 Tax=Cichorium intybus TaxID=13427 RepID=A0ACB8YZT6_CICIN|nr:hypothetical protein L2E82_49251 [Cichorium intybus]
MLRSAAQSRDRSDLDRSCTSLVMLILVEDILLSLHLLLTSHLVRFRLQSNRFQSDYEGISGNVVRTGKLQASVVMLTAMYRRIQGCVVHVTMKESPQKAGQKTRREGETRTRTGKETKTKIWKKAETVTGKGKETKTVIDTDTVTGKEVREGKEEDIKMMMITRSRDYDRRRDYDRDRDDRRSRHRSRFCSRAKSEHRSRSRSRSRSKSKRVSGFDMAPPASAILDGAAAVTAVWKVCTKIHGVILVSKFSSFKELQCHHSPNPSQLLKEGDNSMVDILKLAVISPFYIPLQEHL